MKTIHMSNGTSDYSTTTTATTAAYMIEAAVEIAKEQGFVPANENEVGCWMMNHREAIVKRAIEIQWNLLDRLEKNRKAKDALVTILSAQVWLAANRDKVNNIIENVTR